MNEIIQLHKNVLNNKEQVEKFKNMKPNNLESISEYMYEDIA